MHLGVFKLPLFENSRNNPLLDKFCNKEDYKLYVKVLAIQNIFLTAFSNILIALDSWSCRSEKNRWDCIKKSVAEFNDV